MKREILFIFFGILLISFVMSAGAPITGSATKDDDSNKNSASVGTANAENQETQTQNSGETTQNRIEVQEQNRIKISSTECAEGCVCTGSLTKCQLQNGREMTITAGNSGNVIMQTKGESVETKVQLYKDSDKLYGQFNGETKEVKMMPDQVRQKIQEKLQLRNCSCEMELNDDGNYQVQAKKKAKLLGFISVDETTNVEVDATTGEIVRTRNSWWGFLASDVNEEPILGASCGTVTPGQNDACCQTKGYDKWDSEKGECLFDVSE